MRVSSRKIVASIDSTVSIYFIYTILKRLNIEKVQSICKKCPAIVMVFLAGFEKKSYETVTTEIDIDVIVYLFSQVSYNDIKEMQIVSKTIYEIGLIKEVAWVIITNWLRQFKEYTDITVNEAQALKILSLDGHGIRTLPKEFGILEKIQGLYIRRNNLTQIIPEISGLKNLRHLNISSNCLTFVPLVLKDMPRLQYLNLQNNKLRSIPKELAESKSLRSLDLYDNPILELPNELNSIKEIYISNENVKIK